MLVKKEFIASRVSENDALKNKKTMRCGKCVYYIYVLLYFSDEANLLSLFTLSPIPYIIYACLLYTNFNKEKKNC